MWAPILSVRLEAGIPEDDPRNPACIADNVGDNVGDVAGMGADLYESYVGSILATFSIGASAGYGWNGMFLPIAIAVVGVLCSLIGTYMIRTGEKASQRELLRSMRTGTYFAAALCAALCIPLTYFVMRGIEGANWVGILISIYCGLIAGCAIGYITEYYTSDTYKPTGPCRSTETGPATTIIGSISLGMKSTALPIIIVGIAVIVSFLCSGGHIEHEFQRIIPLASTTASTASASPPSVCSPRWALPWPPTPTVPSRTTPAALPR